MGPFLYIFIIAIFVAMLVFNMYFKVKILKIHKKLQSQRIDFSIAQLMNRTRMKQEVLPKYPQQQDLIMAFASLIRQSFITLLAIIVIISLSGILLNYIL